MKQMIPKMVVLTSQPMGYMFPTEFLIRVATIFIYIDVTLFGPLLSVLPKVILQDSLTRDNRKRFICITLYGDEL